MELRKEYKQTEVGVIPEDWEVISLIDLAERKKELFDDGDWVEAEHITNEGIRLIQTGNIGEGKFIEKEDKKYIRPESFELLKCKELYEGDLLICRLAEPAGRSCVFPDIGENKVITSVDVTIFRPRLEMVNRQYLNQIFTTKTWFNSVSENCGGTTHKRISRGTLGKLSVPIPRLKEQTAIATALSDMDNLIAGLEQLIEKKKAIKQGAMQELLRPKEGWVVKKLGEVAEIRMGQSPSSAFYNTQGIGLPLIQGNADIENRKTIIRVYTSSITKKGKHGDIIMSVRAPVGEVSKATFECCLGRGVCSIRAKNDYLYHYLVYYEKSWAKYSTGSTFDSVNSEQVKALEIPMPEDEANQIVIATILSDMDDEIIMLEENLEKYKLLKQGMMQELLTGKTRLV